MKKIVMYVFEIAGLLLTYLGNKRAKSKQYNENKDETQD